MQANAMRNYHLHHPLDDSPLALPWPKDPLETIRKLADIMRNRARATMQAPAKRPLGDHSQQATHPFFQPHAPPIPPPPVPPKRARRRRRSAAAPSPNRPEQKAEQQSSNPPHAPQPPGPNRRPPHWTPPPPPRPSILIILPSATRTVPARNIPTVPKRHESPTAFPQRPHG